MCEFKGFVANIRRIEDIQYVIDNMKKSIESYYKDHNITDKVMTIRATFDDTNEK